jgi:hypothetical protein
MFTMLEDRSETAARKSLDVIVELYRRRIWQDARTVNVMATACLNDKARALYYIIYDTYSCTQYETNVLCRLKFL